MRARLLVLRENLSVSLWVVPTALVLLACGLATLTLAIDEFAPTLGGLRPWLFGGSASAGRDLLAAIAGSLITVVALAFSVTIVAIQQASTQFSPRVIRNFMRDRGNQAVFGIYIATFVYALLILRQVRAEDGRGGEFVPALSITMGLLLTLLCVALLIYFIHHTAVSLQVATIADAIRRDLRAGMDRLYPAMVAPPAHHAPSLPDAPPTQTLRAPAAGFLRQIDAEGFLAALPEGVTVVRVRPQIGDFLFEGAPIIDLWATAPLLPDVERTLLLACPLGPERSLQQDFLFGIRQLVDIGVKALSPGINDPTTAEHCLVYLGDTIAQLVTRPFPPPWREDPATGALLFLTRPDFAAIVAETFDQLRRDAADDWHVTACLLETLASIGERAAAPERAVALRRQVTEIIAALDQSGFTPADRAVLHDRAGTILAMLDATIHADAQADLATRA